MCQESSMTQEEFDQEVKLSFAGIFDERKNKNSPDETFFREVEELLVSTKDLE